jgi:hypothetical protein
MAALAVVVSFAVVAPSASASISPAMTLTQSTTSAGASANVGIDVSFSPSPGDSPKDLTVILPPGLLANAAIDGGACLSNTSSTPVAACQVGTGTVTAAGLGILPITGDLAFDLVAPPKPGDLAGVAAFLTLLGSTSQLGSPADVTVRPPGSADGVGLNMAFTNMPKTYDGLPISVDQLDTSFDGMRLPASCPSPAVNVTVSGDSYSDPTTRTASKPLTATSCSALPYAPKFSVSAAKDSADSGAKVVTKITQAADEATSRTVVLTLPPKVLTPNVTAVLTGGILCTTPSLAGCKTVGSASATSPLYPRTLTGKTYLTGSFTSPAITIVFPAPFALTLNGSVDLATNSTTFKQLPDIPLTALQVTLSGGPDAVFATTCAASSGTATSTLTTQNGDRTVTAPAGFMVSNYQASTCVPPPGTGIITGSGSGSGPQTGTPRLQAALTGLARGRPTLGFLLLAGSGAPKLRSFTVSLPSGLSFRMRGAHHRLALRGLTVSSAPIRSLVFKQGKLTVTLRAAVAGVTFNVGPRGLKEARGLRRRVRGNRVRTVKLTVVARDAKGTTTTLTARLKHFR